MPMTERNPTRRAAERAREEWGLALASMDEEGQRVEIARMLQEAAEVALPGLKEVLVDLDRDFGRRT